MIKAMGLISIITIFLFFDSCNHSLNEQNRKQIEVNKIEIDQDKNYDFDSISVNYWKITEANEYRFRYAAGIIKIESEYFGFKNKIVDKKIYEPFLEFIDDLYNKNESIVLSRREEPAPESNYPKIEVVGFLKGEKVFEEKTILYSNIVFNPKFLRFYEFLDRLVKQN